MQAATSLCIRKCDRGARTLLAEAEKFAPGGVARGKGPNPAENGWGAEIAFSHGACCVSGRDPSSWEKRSWLKTECLTHWAHHSEVDCPQLDIYIDIISRGSLGLAVTGARLGRSTTEASSILANAYTPNGSVFTAFVARFPAELRHNGARRRPWNGTASDMAPAAFPYSDNETTLASATTITADEDVFGPVYASTLRITLIAVMLVLSLVGNTAVCYRLLTSRRHRVFKAQVLFLNLALADLLVTLVTMNSQLLWEIMGRVWIAGDGPCRMFKVMQTFALVSSTYMLVGIAVDRHYSICKPLVPAPRPRSVATVCWLLSLLPSLPNLFVFRVVVVRDKCYCASVFYIYRDTTTVTRQIYMACVFTLVFVLPLCALVALYTSILVRMRKMVADGTGTTATVRTGLTTRSTSMSQTTTVALSETEDRRSTLPRARLRTLKMAVVIFVAFLVTNLPYMVQEVILAFARDVSLGPHVVAVFGVISASNSAVNPYVYLAFNGGAAGTSCDARVRGLWRRLTCSSGSKRTTIAFRTSCSTLPTRRRKRLITAQGPLSEQKCQTSGERGTPEEQL
ncbi:hypothetical protein HPB50_015699 [Hyalomma asiaticum]|uniref:Uncharacterized protein n=1 Tax=Hyalomma asiaticum TaxID=266040 RepID=A0ACB7SYD7_HYAAI|nr:hypothetical protein HPB50_015699 [Hyalomma asiaticum]